MDVKPLIGLGGVLIAAITAEVNDQVTTIALADVRGGLAISQDPGTWIESLYISAEIVGLAVSPWFLGTFSLRRWTLFCIALCGISSVLIPFCPNIEAIYALRILQGLAGGLIIPLLMTTAFKVLTPDIRIYGLAVYALTATFTPALAATLAALWTDILGDWRFIFFEALPLCTLAAALAGTCMAQEPPQYARFRQFDWRGFLLLVIGSGALSTMLFQGDRLDWWNSQFVCVLALTSAVALPLLFVNEWFHPLPFLKLQLLGRRNVAYGAIGLFTFLIISQASSNVPLQYLEQTQGYRPLQGHLITLEIAAAQLVLLPLAGWLLDHTWAEARAVSFIGLGLMLAACLGSAPVNIVWNRDQFYVLQALQAVGQPLVVMPLLLLSTNTVKDPKDGPFTSAMVNFPRGIAEVTGVWLFDLIRRWRGGLHSDRIIDQIGQNRFTIIQGTGGGPLASALMPNGQPRAPGSLTALSGAVRQQVTILSASDTYLILGGLTLLLMLVVLALPTRTLPPRLEFAEG
jgi:MFS transporter, DHA2 family, multidrug resistance protein